MPAPSAAGATEDEIDAASDADDALAAFVELLLKYEMPAVPDPRDSISAELEAMKPSQRKKKMSPQNRSKSL